VSPAAACEGRFVVRRELGLHARPASRFVSLAGRFQAEVSVARDDEWVSGRSVLSLLSLGAAQGTRLRVRAVGPDAAQAVTSLGELLEEAGEPDAVPLAPAGPGGSGGGS
jgi:phosphotransferase system HPr (HPr) family protein